PPLSMRNCCRTPAAPRPRPVRGVLASAVPAGDLAHDGEAEAAAGPPRAGDAVEALQHALALLRRDTRAVVFDLGEGPAVALAGAHGDAATVIRVLDRVVHQVGERLAQEQRVALDRRRAQLEAETDVSLGRLMDPAVGLGLDYGAQVHIGRSSARARLGAREREQLV